MAIARLCHSGPDGRLQDLQHDIDLAELGEACPGPGDRIVAAAVQNDGSGGSVWEVVQPYFQPCGHVDYIALVVDERPARVEECYVLGVAKER